MAKRSNIRTTKRLKRLLRILEEGKGEHSGGRRKRPRYPGKRARRHFDKRREGGDRYFSYRPSARRRRKRGAV